MLADQLARIADALEASQSSSILYDILLTLPAALLAAGAAIGAAWASVHYANRSTVQSALAGVTLEVESLQKEISRTLDIPTGTNLIACRVVALGSEAIPVFRSNAQYISQIDRNKAESIFLFYTAFLTIPSEENGGKFARNDLIKLVDLAAAVSKGES